MLARWKIVMGRLILQEKTLKIEEKSMFFKNLFLLNDGCWQRCENRKAYFVFGTMILTTPQSFQALR